MVLVWKKTFWLIPFWLILMTVLNSEIVNTHDIRIQRNLNMPIRVLHLVTRGRGHSAFFLTNQETPASLLIEAVLYKGLRSKP